MNQIQRGPGETITQAKDMAFNQLQPFCNVLQHNDRIITMADKVKNLIEKGYVVQSPAEFIEVDGCDGPIENGQTSWVIVSTKGGREFRPFHQYVNDSKKDVIENNLVHPSEIGIK